MFVAPFGRGICCFIYIIFFEIHLSSMCLTTSLTCAVSYVFAVYTLVTFFSERFADFFFNTQIMSTSGTIHWMLSLFIFDV